MIEPAIAALEKEGIQAFGPYAADKFFGGSDWEQFDGVLAMYYEQGLTPFRSLTVEGGVNYLAGLPLVRTAPETPANFSIAGKGVADAMPMRHAIYLAIDIFRHRKEYDEPLGNPLAKLYKERRDDSEKVRFAVPKTQGRIIEMIDSCVGNSEFRCCFVRTELPRFLFSNKRKKPMKKKYQNGFFLLVLWSW